MWLDIGMGIMLGAIANIFTHYENCVFYIFFGILSALAPDIDYLVYLIRKWFKNYKRREDYNKFFYPFFLSLFLMPVFFIDFVKHCYKQGLQNDRWTCFHRELLHYPLLFILISPMFFKIDSTLGYLWLGGTMYHFIVDTYTAWGIRWGFPFWKKYIVLTPYSPEKIVDSKEKLKELIAKYGNDEWDKKPLASGVVTFLTLNILSGIFCILIGI